MGSRTTVSIRMRPNSLFSASDRNVASNFAGTSQSFWLANPMLPDEARKTDVRRLVLKTSQYFLTILGWE